MKFFLKIVILKTVENVHWTYKSAYKGQRIGKILKIALFWIREIMWIDKWYFKRLKKEIE